MRRMNENFFSKKIFDYMIRYHNIGSPSLRRESITATRQKNEALIQME